MGNGYPVVQPDELTELRDAIASLKRRVRELEMPTGSQSAEVVRRMVQFSSSGVSQQNFAIGTSPITVASGTIDVPDGFTSATVMCIAGVTGINASGVTAYMLCRASINGTGGGERSTGAVADTLAGGSTASAIRTMTGLNGGTITVATVVRSSAGAWGTNANNTANTDAIVMFRR